jgi:glycosyltransferase involved in cell wall biosynthesis
MEMSIIIPTRDRDLVLRRTMEALLAALEGVRAEVLLINDSEHSIEGIGKDERVLVLRNPGKGASAARNFGAKRAKGRILLFLDDDIIVSSVNIRRTLELHSKGGRVAYNFFWFFPPDLMQQLSHSKFGRYLQRNGISSQWSRMGGEQKDPPAMISEYGIASYYFSIEKDLFLSTGGYEERIPFAGVEDIVLAKKFRELEIAMLLSTKDVVFHNESDRVELFQVMERYRRASITMNAAVKAGHVEFEREFSKGKRITYAFFLPFKGVLLGMSRLVPNLKLFDPLYFRFSNLLLGLSSWQGYRESR